MPNLRGPLVVALLYDGLCTFEFGIAAEVFGLSRPEMGADWYRFASAAIEAGPLLTRAHIFFWPRQSRSDSFVRERLIRGS
jgi:AraC family transcriptional activator FtrA